MATILVSIVDADLREVTGAGVRIEASGGRVAEVQREGNRWSATAGHGVRVTICAEAEGLESEKHSIVLRQEVTQLVVGLRGAGQLAYTYGDSRFAFAPSQNAFVVRIRGKGASEAFAAATRLPRIRSRSLLSRPVRGSDHVFSRIEGHSDDVARAVQQIKASHPLVDVALPIEHAQRPTLGLTQDLIVAFRAGVGRAERDRACAEAGLQVVREIRHAGNAVLATLAAGLTYDILRVADVLAGSDRVAYVEPNLLFATESDAYVPNDPLWAQVPYLQLINVDDAWARLGNVAANLRGGSPAITVAIVDDEGVTPDHPELLANLTDGSSKLVSSTNFSTVPVVAQTVSALGGSHGTKCAGSAAAAFDDSRGLPGVAPNCHLIGAYILPAIDALYMADVYLWVAGFLNGSTVPGFPTAPPAHGADVISSSWGPAAPVALSNVLRDCFDFLTCYGRAGKGCVLCFSIGNSGYAAFTDPTLPRYRAWASYEKTLAVGASMSVNPTNPIPASGFPDPAGNTLNLAAAVDTRALYSPFGAINLRKPDLVAPANTTWNPANVPIDPVLAAVPVGTGAVNGCTTGAPCNDYAFDFGGTSHATPVVAGAVALMLSARPDLNWVQVRDILRESCARIDAAQGDAVGMWKDLDGDGNIDFSRWYGAGRLDVDAAIALCLNVQRAAADIYVRDNMADTGAVPSMGTWWESPDIWVRRDSGSPVPALPWTDPPPHQNPLRGQDNAVFCRVRNRGTAPATVTYVRAMIAHWPGLEFAYPQDFEPSNDSGLILGAPAPTPLSAGTYLIGEARIDVLGPGADQIVKFIWDQALIPPETFVYNGATVAWHPCLLVEASPHDGPPMVAGGSVPVQGDNNIAQRNVHILNAGEMESKRWIGMVAGTRRGSGIDGLIVDATGIEGTGTLCLHVADSSAMQRWIAVNRSDPTARAGEASSKNRSTTASMGRTMGGDKSPTAMNEGYFPVVEFARLGARIRLPLSLAGGEFVLLLVCVTGKARGNLVMTQHRNDGAVSAGYGIRIT